MNRRGKIGAFFLAGESWWEAGICDAKEGPYAGFLQNVESDVQAITARLAERYQVVSSGLVHTAADAAREAQLFNEASVDAVVFCPIIWTNDAPVVAFLQEARRVPLFMWAYNPYAAYPEYFRIQEWVRASGPVSVQQSSNILRRFGWEYDVVFGNEADGEPVSELCAMINAAVTFRSLRGAQIAVLPAPCRVVISTWMDEFDLLTRFGVELRYVSVEEYARAVRNVSGQKAGEYAAFLRDNYPCVGVDEEMLLDSARQALALVELIREYGLCGIALEDFNREIYSVLGFRPHLYHPDIGEAGCTIGFEADVLNVLSTVIAGRLAGTIGMFNEFFTIDRGRNTILMGHPGQGETRLADPETLMVTPDLEFDETQKRGAWLSYRAKAGEMTFLNFTAEFGKLKAGVFQGQALPGPRVMEGYAHMVVRAHADVGTLFRRIVKDGLIQHWGTVYGNILREIEVFARIAGLDLRVYD